MFKIFEPIPESQKTKKSIKDYLPVILAVLVVLLATALLLVILLGGKKQKTPTPTPSQTPSSSTVPSTTAPTEPEIKEEVTSGIYFENSKTLAVTFGDATVNMGMLQMFYTSIINNFLSEYGTNLSYIGLDLTKSLAEQEYPYEEAETWQDFFLQLAVERWQNSVTLRKLAKEENYVMDQELYDMIDEQIAKLPELAKEKGYPNATAMVQAYYGDACNVDLYREYLTMDTEAEAYYYHVLDVTDEEVEAYFQENEAALAEKEITKNGKLVSNVRHFLIYPKGGTLAEDGKTKTYTEAEWAACKVEADKLITEWKNGGATEEYFIEMVKKYTEDLASKDSGGLYENISNTGKYVPEFEAWAVDANRKTGDVEAVKTVYGYHIMYYVSGQPEYMYYSRIMLQNDRLTVMGKKVEEAMKDKESKIETESLTLQNIFEK